MKMKQSFQKSPSMNMKFVNVILFVLVYATCISGQLGGLSSKLDFGDTEESKPASKKIIETIVSVRELTPQAEETSQKIENPFNIRKFSIAADEAAEKLKEDFKELSLICINGSCNTTKSTNVKGSQLKADVIVKVLTNVKENESKTEITGNKEDSDVPVIVGTGGKESGRRIDVTAAPIYIPYNVNQNVDLKPKDHVQLPISHFNPNFNNHYFGESAPPVYVWHKRRNSVNNQHSFVPNSRPYWKANIPSNDGQRSMPSNTNRRLNPVLCTCANPPLNLYPYNVDEKRDYN